MDYIVLRRGHSEAQIFVMFTTQYIMQDTVIASCVGFLNHDAIDHIADNIYRACQDDSNIASIKKLNVRLVEIEQAIENLWNALELGDAAERITKRINAREEEKAEIERQLAIERRKIKSFDYPRIHAFLEQMKGLNCGNIHDRSKLATMFIHTIFYYDDYLIIIMNGGKGLVTAENIPLKSIENSLHSDISGTFSGSSVCQPAPPWKKPSFVLLTNEGFSIKINYSHPWECKGERHSQHYKSASSAARLFRDRLGQY